MARRTSRWHRCKVQTNKGRATRVDPPRENNGLDEQDMLLREIFYTSDTERARTTEGATSWRSRTTTEDVPFSFESSNEYEGLDNNRHTGTGGTGTESAPATAEVEPARVE